MPLTADMKRSAFTDPGDRGVKGRFWDIASGVGLASDHDHCYWRDGDRLRQSRIVPVLYILARWRAGKVRAGQRRARGGRRRATADPSAARSKKKHPHRCRCGREWRSGRGLDRLVEDGQHVGVRGRRPVVPALDGRIVARDLDDAANEDEGSFEARSQRRGRAWQRGGSRLRDTSCRPSSQHS